MAQVDWSAIAQAGAAVMNTASSIYGAYQSVEAVKEANKANAELMREQNAFNRDMWHEQNDYNSPAHQVELMKQANLNPNLMYSNGQASISEASPVTSAQSAPMQAATFNPPQLDIDFLRAKEINHRVKNLDAQSEQAKAYTEYQKTTNANLQRKLDDDHELSQAQKEEIIANRKLTDKKMDEVAANIRQINNTITLSNKRLKIDKKKANQEIRESEARIKKIAHDNNLSDALAAQAAANVQNLAQDTLNKMKQGVLLDEQTFAQQIDNYVEQAIANDKISKHDYEAQNQYRASMIDGFKTFNPISWIFSLGNYAHGASAERTNDWHNPNSHYNNVLNPQP